MFVTPGLTSRSFDKLGQSGDGRMKYLLHSEIAEVAKRELRDHVENVSEGSERCDVVCLVFKIKRSRG